jgi:ribosome-interacting GTPase 1
LYRGTPQKIFVSGLSDCRRQAYLFNSKVLIISSFDVSFAIVNQNPCIIGKRDVQFSSNSFCLTAKFLTIVWIPFKISYYGFFSKNDKTLQKAKSSGKFMPANLTQQYKKAEDHYRRAETPEEELKWLQVMLAEMPKHKGTDHLQAKLKTQISQLRKEMEQQRSGSKKGGTKSFRIPRQGAGTAVIIGGPNAGKSQLLASLTRAAPEIAVYPFTTKQPQPGMMAWNDVFIQLIDTPPITSDYLEPYLVGLLRSADLALLMIDLGDDNGMEQCKDVLGKLATTKTRLAAESSLDEEDVGLAFTQTFFVANKIDDPEAADRLELFHEMCPLPFREFRVSANNIETLEHLRNAIYESLNVLRIYTKDPKKKEADRDKPFTLNYGDTLLDLAELIHKDYAKNLKFGKVWGSAVHDGTIVKGDYILNDQDVIEVHI